jgi:putative addiction module component (TIGR02574 family)
LKGSFSAGGSGLELLARVDAGIAKVNFTPLPSSPASLAIVPDETLIFGILDSMSRELLTEILKLSPPERIQLVEDIWDSIGPLDTQMTKAQEQELDRRTAALEKDSEQGIPWEDVKKELLARK